MRKSPWNAAPDVASETIAAVTTDAVTQDFINHLPLFLCHHFQNSCAIREPASKK